MYGIFHSSEEDFSDYFVVACDTLEIAIKEAKRLAENRLKEMRERYTAAKKYKCIITDSNRGCIIAYSIMDSDYVNLTNLDYYDAVEEYYVCKLKVIKEDAK